MTPAAVAIDREAAVARVALSGDLRLGGVESIVGRLGEVAGPGPVVVDGSGIEAFDTAGAWAIATLRRRLAAEGVEVRIEGLAPERAALLETVEKSLPKDEAPAPKRSGFVLWLGQLGEGVADGWSTGVEILSLLGAVLTRLAGNLLHPSRLRLTSVVYHMQAAGLERGADRRADGLPDRRGARLHGRGAAAASSAPRSSSSTSSRSRCCASSASS